MILHFLQFFYLGNGHPWYQASVWGNVFVIPIAAALGIFWAKTKFWPLKPLEQGVHHLHTKVDGLHAKHDAHAEHLDRIEASLTELHAKHDHLLMHLDRHDSGYSGAVSADVRHEEPPESA